eukprot:11212549-Lingulodinium_polyedra.AAC.1
MLSLGSPGGVTLLVWMLGHKQVGASSSFHLPLPGEQKAPVVQWVHVLDFAEYQVTPCLPASPLHAWLQCKGPGGASRFGVSLLKTGRPLSVLANAANHAFWRLSKAILKKVMASEGLD